MKHSVPADAAILTGRLLIALLFLHEGWIKITHLQASMGYMQNFGLPGVLLWPALALEIGGGLALLTGWASRPFSLGLALFCVAAALIFHCNLGDGNQLLHFEKDLAIAGGLLAHAVAGPGRFAWPAAWLPPVLRSQTRRGQADLTASE
jgi:putative oxidoreductase